MKTLYETEATAIGGRDGAAATSDGRLRVNLAIPGELGGAGGDGANPEQLFALGYAACFLTAIRNVAGQSNIEIASDANVTATVGIGPRDEEEGLGLKGLGLQGLGLQELGLQELGLQELGLKGLALRVALTIDLPDLDRPTAQHLVDRAHAICPYSDAMRGKLEVKRRVA